MSDWTQGYVADIGYTYGYYSFLNPLRARLAFWDRGLAFPEVENACELGFGQGLSVNIHAAASSVKWYGTDFNPAQASFAQKLAEVSQNGAQLFADSFETFARRKDLPDFEFIGLHGIWTWISNNNRRVIVNFIKKKLKPGGVLYISYNTLPGWADFLPIRHLMSKYFIVATGSARDRVRQVQDTADFMNYFLSVKPKFMKANPRFSERVHELTTRDPRYLAHEYFNQDWQPMYFADMADWLSEAEMDYACSARYLANMHQFSLTDEQRKFLNQLATPQLKESMFDFLANIQFRTDYWIRGAQELTRKEQTKKLRQQRYMLCGDPEAVSLKIHGAQKEIDLDQAVYTPLLELLADFRPRTMDEMEQALSSKNIKPLQLRQALLVLTHRGEAAPLQDEAVAVRSRERCARLNAFLREQARKSDDIACWASPVTGGGIGLSRIEQLFLDAAAQGNSDPDAWSRHVWSYFAPEGSRALKDGKPLETEAENLAELERLAGEFTEKRLPILKTLGIA